MRNAIKIKMAFDGRLCHEPPSNWEEKILRIMRLTSFILLLGCLQVSANGGAQTVTLFEKNAKLEHIFFKIHQQIGYDFLYNSQMLSDAKRVNIQVKAASLTEVLNICFRDQPFLYLIRDKTIVITKRPADARPAQPEKFSASPPPVEITGRVTDAEGEPLEGVSVVATGTRLGTVTDANGNYSFLVGENVQQLSFSFTGYIPQVVELKGQTQIDITLVMEDSRLNAVAVTALGITKAQKSLGYSVEQVNGKVFEKVKTDNFMNQLNGRVAGLTVNSRYGLLEDPVIMLRGRNPIITVDGLPVDSYKAINPDIIKSVSVLKGPQAALLYGSRGKDGAIIITTKKAGNTEKLIVQVNSSNMVTAGFLTIPELQNEYGTGADGKYAFLDGIGNGVNDGSWIWGPKLDQPDPSTPSGWWETTQYNSPVDPVTGDLVPLPWRSYGNNLQKFLRPGFVSNNNISISGKRGKGGYRMGINHLLRQGMVPNTALNGLGLHLAGNYDISSRLHAEASIIYNNLFTHNTPHTGYDNGQLYYNAVIYMPPNVDILDLKNYWQEGQAPFKQRNHNYVWFQNPWFIAHEYERPFNEPEVISSVSLDYDLTKDLNLMLKVGHNHKQTDQKDNLPYAWVRGTRGQFTTTATTKSLLDANLLLAYKKNWKRFEVDGLVGGNWNDFHQYSIISRTNELVVPNIYSLANSRGPVTTTDATLNKRTLGLFGSFTFSYDNKIFLGLTGRNDWSSTLARNNRSYFYPSVSLSALISEWVSLPEVISYWQVRSSWAQVGRDMDPYRLNPVYTFHSYWEGAPAYTPSNILIDNDIKPSRTTSIEYGTDIRLWRNLIGLDITYFNTKDDRWIQEIVVPATAGYNRMLINGNVYTRSGLEISLSANPISREGLSWNIQANWFTNKMVLSRVYDGSGRYGNMKVGDRTDAMIDAVYLRQPGTDNFIVDPNNGRKMRDPFPRLVGHVNADWEAGIENTIRIKKFTVNVLVSGRWGGLFYSDLIARMIQSGVEPRTTVYRDEYNRGELFLPDNAVVVTGGEIIYDADGNVTKDTRTFEKSQAKLSWNTWMSDLGAYRGPKTIGWNVYDASFLKLRTLTVSYDFGSLFRHSVFKSLQASVIGSNLLMLKKMPHEDPDTNRTDLGFPTERFIGFNFSFTL